MTSVNESVLKNWNEGETMHSDDYEQERALIVAAINGSDKQVKELLGKANPDAMLYATKSESWTATEGQTDFVLTKGKYLPGNDRIKVHVGAVKQTTVVNFTEVDEKTIRLSEGVPAGTKVDADWLEGILIAPKDPSVHAATHKAGGSDEIRITELAGWSTEVAPYIGDLGIPPKVQEKFDAQLAETASQWINVKFPPVPLVAAVGDGIADDTSIFQSAMNNFRVFIPDGTYRITSSLIVPNGLKMVGSGKNTTILKSDIIGGSLFKTTASSVAFVYIADMQLKGNGIVGVGGNGHAINFIDPAIDSGTHTPQSCVIERLYIRDFLGFDKRDNGATTIESCAVIQHDGLQNIYRDITVANCGHGFYMKLVQNSKIVNCVVDGALKYALFAYNCETLIADKCDFVNSGDGIESAGYPEAGLLSGNVLSARNSNFVLTHSKIKNTSGTAQLVSKFSENDVIRDNWIRGGMLSDKPHKGIYAVRSPGIRIDGNTFSPSLTSFAAQKYEQIELYNDSTNEGFSATIDNNIFSDVSGQNIAYNIKIGGNSSVRTFPAVSIQKNKFGSRDARSAASTVDADILISACTLTNSRIANNHHYAPTNVTRSLGVSASTVTLTNNRIETNMFQPNGGTITTNYSGITESVLTASATYDPPSLADNASATTTITVTGATLGDYVEASLQLDTQGITVTAWVSAANTVSVRFRNSTGGTIDLASTTLRVRVVKP